MDLSKVYFKPKLMKNYIFFTFFAHNSINVSHLHITKKIKMVTPQVLSFRKGKPKKFELFSLKFHDFPLRSINY